MTENVFGIWVRRFPCLKNMRCHYENAKEIIDASAILHNYAILWGDEWPENDLEENHQNDRPNEEQYVVLAEHDDAVNLRRGGQERRDQLLREMPPQGRRERIL